MVIINPEQSLQSIEQYLEDSCNVDIICLFGRYPFAHFSLLAIVHILSAGKSAIENSLKQLVSSGILITSERNDVVFYSLAEKPSIRQAVIKFASYNWLQRRLILNRNSEKLAESDPGDAEGFTATLVCLRPIINNSTI